MNREVQGFLHFRFCFHFERKRKETKSNDNRLTQRVFHSFSLPVNKKPVEKVENSVDNSKTRLSVKGPSQTLETRRGIFCQGFFRKTQKVFMT